MPQNYDWLVHHFDWITGSRASLRRGGDLGQTRLLLRNLPKVSAVDFRFYAVSYE